MAAKGGISRAMESMSPRDRKLLSGLLMFLALLFVGILLWTLNGWLSDRAATIAQQKSKYEVLVVMQQEYAIAHQEVLNAEATIELHKGKTPSAFLEEAASNTGVSESLTVSKQGSETTGSAVETRYKVVLRRVTLEETVDFLHGVETSGYPIAIDSATLKTSHLKGEKVITLTLDAVHYDFGATG